MSQGSADQGAKILKPSSDTDIMKQTDVYYLYLNKVCSDSIVHGTEGASDIFERRCQSYSTAAKGTIVRLRAFCCAR
jgi:hypothetical protein